MFQVYILLCADESYYTGITRHLKRRLKQHHEGKVVYTSSRLPARLVYQENFDTETEAVARERQIKGWTRKKKEALIAGDAGQLRTLAKKDFD